MPIVLLRLVYFLHHSPNKKVPAGGTFLISQINKLFFYLYVTGADNMYSMEIRSAEIWTFFSSDRVGDPVSNGSVSIIPNQESMPVISEKDS